MNNATKNKPKKIEELTKEQIRQAIIKKRECNAKAQQIVESLLEKCINEAYLLKCLPDINQSHFEDVIEERAIIHLCGFPLCPKAISPKDIPKQKYRISMKTNKVYDITTRKSFCSNTCYKSAMYIKKQMLTSPLWFREYEEVPKFYILPDNTVSSLGQEIDLKLIEQIDIKSESKPFTSFGDFTTASLSELHNKDKNKTKDIKECTNEKLTKKPVDKKCDTSQLKFNVPESKTDQLPNNLLAIKDSNIQQSPTTNMRDRNNPLPVPNPLNIVGEIIEKPEKKIDPILINVPTELRKAKLKPLETKAKKQVSVTAITIEVEKCLAEWFTLDSLLFIFGEEKVKELVEDKGEYIKEYLKNQAQSIFHKSNLYDQYQALCRKLNILELEDKKYDTQMYAKEMKPLPDYKILKEESKNLQLKVKAFFAGETEIPVNNSTTETTEVAKAIEDNVTQLPLVDKNAQNALRRGIVCQHLNKVLPDLLRSLGLLTLSVSADVRLLVNTFQLKANNIMFKPIQWTLIAIIFIKLLSLRDGRLAYLLKQSMAFQHMQLLLLSYQQDGGYLDRLVLWLTDVDRLLDVSNKQLTIETATN
ncbi:putative RNA polymerase II subunit B1 CTD phosphatase RPAP2 [Pieris rapae]|uniref:putative RNA polymerase II subunit B1 CTD phosphatase RPAP2 n=1 Tax=Pieris rapae TaxID=64459 RepID=UPI001E27E6D4|nr:putative RNA polymerase II subunit B1 CTD phosphatase RPAP2 [Pieris rapae]